MDSELLKIVGSGYESLEVMYNSGVRVADLLLECQAIDQENTVLDYGAGLGRLSVPLSRYCEVTAFDPNLEMRAALRVLGLNVVSRPVGNWDCGLCMYVLQHLTLSELRSVLQHLATLVSELVFTVPTYEQWSKLDNEPPACYCSLGNKRSLPLVERSSESFIISAADVPDIVEGTAFDPDSLEALPFDPWGTWKVRSKRVTSRCRKTEKPVDASP